MTAYRFVLKFLQVSVKSITHLKSAIALYKSVLFLSNAIKLIVSDSISVDPDPTGPIDTISLIPVNRSRSGVVD